MTKDSTTGEYVGSSKTKWENSPYNSQSKVAGDYRFIALNNLFTAGGESTKEALNYMSEHPEDPAVVRFTVIINKVSAPTETVATKPVEEVNAEVANPANKSTPTETEETKREKLGIPANASKLTSEEYDSLKNTYGMQPVITKNGSYSIWNVTDQKLDKLTQEQAIKILQMQEDTFKEKVQK